MADVVVASDLTAVTARWATNHAVVFTSASVGYAFYVDVDNGFLYYRKTTDGGATWGDPVALERSFPRGFDVWFEKWTPGDSGTKIGIWCWDSSPDDLLFRTLDSADDSLGSWVNITNQATAINNNNAVSGCKTRGGGWVATAFCTNVAGLIETWTSADGATWSAEGVSVWGASIHNRCVLLPGNESDANDVWAIHWDQATSVLSFAHFDDSVPSWGLTTIASSMVVPDWNVMFPGVAAAVRHSDGHLIAAAWSEYDAATADLRVWDINGSGSITEKTAVLTNVDNAINVALFIDQNTNDLYVAYLGKADGSEAPESAVKVYYKKSTDGGATWGSEVAYSEDAASDIRNLWAPVGGASSRMFLLWADATDDDLKGNTTNSIAITPPGPSGGVIAAHQRHHNRAL